MTRIFLAQSSIFEALAEIVGIPSAAVEGGAVVALAIGMLYLLRVLMMKEKEDVQQLGLSTQLVSLLAQTVEGFGNLQSAIEANTQALTGAFEGIGKSVGTQVAPLKEGLEEVRKQLLTNRKTRVVVKDGAGQVIAELHAEPATDEHGKPYLEVQLDIKKNE